MRRALLVVAVLVGAAARGAPAQSSAGALIAAGRAQLDVPNPDSAATLLQKALQPANGAAVAEQTRAFVLYGIAELMQDNRGSARQAFRQALRLDPTLRIDSLAFFHGELQREFEAERAALVAATVGAAKPVLTVDLDVPMDTTVSPPDGRLRITLKRSLAARVAVTIGSVDSPLSSIWSDSQGVGTVGSVTWNLRGRDKLIVPAGRYVVRATATDSVGHVTSPVEWILLVTRPGLDTTAQLPPLPDSLFTPDSVRTHPGSVWWIVGGVAGSAALGAAGKSSSNKAEDRALHALPMVVGLTLFFATKKTRESPTAERNRRLIAENAQHRAAIAKANAHAKEIAAVRIQVEGLLR